MASWRRTCRSARRVCSCYDSCVGSCGSGGGSRGGSRGGRGGRGGCWLFELAYVDGGIVDMVSDALEAVGDGRAAEALVDAGRAYHVVLLVRPGHALKALIVWHWYTELITFALIVH